MPSRSAVSWCEYPATLRPITSFSSGVGLKSFPLSSREIRPSLGMERSFIRQSLVDKKSLMTPFRGMVARAIKVPSAALNCRSHRNVVPFRPVRLKDLPMVPHLPVYCGRHEKSLPPQKYPHGSDPFLASHGSSPRKVTSTAVAVGINCPRLMSCPYDRRIKV